ncbi:MAG TPA: ACT domain-containing protein [Amaricoccus sp.]|nr:ACT domain-containing protein [Amaricoccus sp.]
MATAGGETDLGRMLAGLDPRLDPAEWVFVSVPPPGPHGGQPLMRCREDEGMTLVLRPEEAVRLGLPPAPVFRRITLGVHSILEGVGLTAAVATALAGKGISANMVAAFHHDHVFVPADRAEEALACLLDLRGGAQAGR